MKASSISIVVAVAALAFGATVASAQTAPTAPVAPVAPTPPAPAPTPEPPPVVVSTTSPLPLLINGLESEKLPTAVAAGTRVCVTERLYYKTEGERWTFQGWSSGSEQECIAPTRAGTYRATFLHEVLVVVRSTATEFQSSQWVPYGVPLDLEVPATTPAREDSLSRFRFVQWSDGETPFDVHNRIAPVKPTVLDVKWVLEHRVTVSGPPEAQIKGSAWYGDGTNLVLQAPDVVPSSSEGQRSKFVRWQSTGAPSAVIGNATATQATLKIDAPYSVQAVYDKQWFVSARTPAGTLKRDWITDGQDVVVDAPPVLDVAPERERLVFKRWDGVDGILSPRFGGPVDRPVAVTAVYEREVMLKVDAPHGVSGDGWQKAGTVATVSVPQSVSSMFLFKSTFAGFSGYPPDQFSVQVLMSQPVSLTAVYRTEVDLSVLGILLLIPFIGILAVLSFRWVPALWGLRSSRRGSVAPTETPSRMPQRDGANVTTLQKKKL